MSVATALGRLLGASRIPTAPSASRIEGVPASAAARTAASDGDAFDDIDAWHSAPLSAEITSPVDPSFVDLEAAVALVASGVATHVILSGFPSWPGLLWKAHELARDAGVSIVPRLASGDGRVDLEVTGDVAGGD